MGRIARGQDPLTESDLDNLPTGAREILSPHLGKPVCGLASLIGLVPHAGDAYQPSAAFVAQQAAALVVGALIARRTGVITSAMRDIEYDARYGPHPDTTSHRRSRADCACRTDPQLVNDIRDVRHRLRGGVI
jgi:hypothetical protein